MKDVIKRISILVFLSLLVFQCSKYRKKPSISDEVEIKTIVKDALNYILKSEEYLFIFDNEKLKPFLVQPKYDYFSFNRVPSSFKDSIFELGGTRYPKQIESNINIDFFDKKNNTLLDLSSGDKSNQIISFTGSDGKYLIATIKFADKEFTVEELKSDGWEEDSCQEWLFFFILEDGEIKNVIHSSRHC